MILEIVRTLRISGLFGCWKDATLALTCHTMSLAQLEVTINRAQGRMGGEGYKATALDRATGLALHQGVAAYMLTRYVSRLRCHGRHQP
jgi:hypothetical protein